MGRRDAIYQHDVSLNLEFMSSKTDSKDTDSKDNNSKDSDYKNTGSKTTNSKDTNSTDADSKSKDTGFDLYAVFSYRQLMLDTVLVLNDQQLEILCDAKKCKELLAAHPNTEVCEIVQPLLRLYEKIGKETKHQERYYLMHQIRRHIGKIRVKRTCSVCRDVINDSVRNHCVRRDTLLCRDCELNSIIHVEV